MHHVHKPTFIHFIFSPVKKKKKKKGRQMNVVQLIKVDHRQVTELPMTLEVEEQQTQRM